MPRIRTVKPEFWAHPAMGRASDGAKCLALALLNFADDEGYFQADPVLVRNFARPFDVEPKTTHGLITELCVTEWIEVRTHPTHGAVGWIPKFRKHQVVNRPRKSALKAYFEQSELISQRPPTPDHTRITDRSVEVHSGKGREGNGKEDSTRAREPDPGPAAAWDSKLLDRLRKAFGKDEFTSPAFADFLVASLRFPKAQREAAVEKFLLEKHAEKGKSFGYLVAMIRGGAEPAEPRKAETGGRYLPSREEQEADREREREHRELVRKEREERKAKGLPPLDPAAFVRRLSDRKTMQNGSPAGGKKP